MGGLRMGGLFLCMKQETLENMAYLVAEDDFKLMEEEPGFMVMRRPFIWLVLFFPLVGSTLEAGCTLEWLDTRGSESLVGELCSFLMCVMRKSLCEKIFPQEVQVLEWRNLLCSSNSDIFLH